MNGLELSEKYFEEFGRSMLEDDFSEILDYIAVGFTGQGSEKFGFDDEISHDHDFEPGFCIFLPDEQTVDRRTAFELERAYSKLPNVFMGYKRNDISPVGGNRLGVFRISDFFSTAIGSPNGLLSKSEWLNIPDCILAQAVNGKIFLDNYGEMTDIRNALKNMPINIKKKRISRELFVMAQSGQYNYQRCISHGEPEAAQLAINEFVISAMKILFLISNEYMPFYKWSFRALKNLQCSNIDLLSDNLSKLLLCDNSISNVSNKIKYIDEISNEIAFLLFQKKLTDKTINNLEENSYYINNLISDCNIRNM